MLLRFPVNENTITAATESAVEALGKMHENEKLIDEYRLLVEELVRKLVGASAPGAELTLDVSENHRKFRLRFSCAGKPVSLTRENEDDLSGLLLDEYADCLQQSYTAGTNHVSFSAAVTFDRFLLRCAISFAAALVCYTVARFFLPESALVWIDSNLFFPISTIFTEAMTMLATPVAFFSLAASLISLYMSWDNNRRLDRVIVRYFASSVAVIVIGFASAMLLKNAFRAFDPEVYATARVDILGATLGGFFEEAVVSNLVEIFFSENPLPMLLFSVLMALAAVRLFGRTGENVRGGILGLHGIFSQMLNFLYSLAPFFLFFSVVTSLYDSGYSFLWRVLLFLALLTIPCCLALLGYAFSLRLSGLPLRDFREKYGAVVLENLRIGSNIQAFPYNRRQLRRITGLPRAYLNETLRLGTIMNMDGSSLVTSFAITLYVNCCGIRLPWHLQLALFLVLLLVSAGAPNQPGSCLLIMVVLFRFVGISSVLLADILVVEVFFGKFYSFLNSLGDIVSIASYTQTSRAKQQAED